MKIYNTLTRKKEEFVPITPGEVKMYSCGPTVYNYFHIGNARPFIMFDLMRRYLEYRGYKVTFVQNFTDIDDKVIKKANEENTTYDKIADRYIAEYFVDSKGLGIKPATVHPKATENIPEIIDIVSTLVDKGYAYEANGDVYFRTRAFKEYGKLSHQPLEDLEAGARIDVREHKEDPMDFALWKAAKPGEPSWDSPWGKGRPGWHIECSAMSKEYLPLDIHGGGQDLIFPHHENEIAQTEAACSCQLARFWVHNGFVQVNAEKMSKSLGNFKTIRDILASYLPETLRFFLLGKHYRSPIDFTADIMDESEKALQRIYECQLEAGKALERAKWKKVDLPADILKEWDEHGQGFNAALDDDVNTAQALGHIFSQVRLVNRVLEDKALRAGEGARRLLEEFFERRNDWSAQLGLFGQDPATFLLALRDQRAARLNIDVPRVQALLDERAAARAAKDFARSDELRAALAELGVAVRDTVEGQVWDIA